MDERDIGTLWYISDGRIEEAELNTMRNGNAEYKGMSLRAYEEYKKAKKLLITENAHKDQEIRVARRMGLEATVNNAKQGSFQYYCFKRQDKRYPEIKKIGIRIEHERTSIQRSP